MMSMGSLGHYMHDLSSIGFEIKDFLHEGNGKPWEFAMLGPGRPRRMDRRSKNRPKEGTRSAVPRNAIDG